MPEPPPEPRVSVAIFGGGRVGTAMSLEMPGVPVVRRGEDLACEVACICWPAHAIWHFAATHPLAARSATKVAFCNGAWATEAGADDAGICYVRATGSREVGAGPDRKSWRTGSRYAAVRLQEAGLGVVCSREDHLAHVWCKCLFLLPLALACADTGQPARVAARTEWYAEWYAIVRATAVAAIGEERVARKEPRAKFLVDRCPKGWRPSPSPEELEYFRERLICVD